MTLKFFTEHVLCNPGEGLYSKAFREYQRFIDEHDEILPLTVTNLVRSDWYFNARDHRCPKDAWVVKKCLTNDYQTETREKRSAELNITLLGAYHDTLLNFRYNSVLELDLEGEGGSLIEKNYDPWRIDEFSLDDDAKLIHKIYFLSGKIWRIKCENFELGVSNLE